jgi:hypothetical protein
MPDYRNIVWNVSAAAVMAQRNRLLGREEQIVTSPDDLGVGPLRQADLPVETERSAFFAQLLAVDSRMDAEARSAVLERFAHERSALFAALELPQPVVVWVGNNVEERLLLAMVASLIAPQTALSVVEICDASGQGVLQSVVTSTPESLLSRVARPVAGSERAALVRQWEQWKAQGQGWRRLEADGRIAEYPFDHLDDVLSAHLARSGPMQPARLAGEVMGDYPAFLGDSLLLWRLDGLLRTGRLARIDDAGNVALSH